MRLDQTPSVAQPSVWSYRAGAVRLTNGPRPCHRAGRLAKAEKPPGLHTGSCSAAGGIVKGRGKASCLEMLVTVGAVQRTGCTTQPVRTGVPTYAGSGGACPGWRKSSLERGSTRAAWRCRFSRIVLGSAVMRVCHCCFCRAVVEVANLLTSFVDAACSCSGGKWTKRRVLGVCPGEGGSTGWFPLADLVGSDLPAIIQGRGQSC